MQYDLPLAIVVCNDNAYGMIKAAQERSYAGRVIDTELRNPDFVAYGRAFGAYAERLSGPDQLAGALAAPGAGRSKPARPRPQAGPLPLRSVSHPMPRAPWGIGMSRPYLR